MVYIASADLIGLLKRMQVAQIQVDAYRKQEAYVDALARQPLKRLYAITLYNLVKAVHGNLINARHFCSFRILN